MALTRLGTDQLGDGIVTNAKISGSAAIAGSKLADDMTYGSNFTISGNLTVNGTTTTVDTTNMSIEDPLLVFSSGATSSASVDAGFVVERGDDTNVGIIWDESADKFNFITTNETGSTAGNVTVAGQANIIAGNIEGTITTAAQNSITSATGLVSVGAIGTGSWAATDVAVAHGGTGSSTASGARTNLGVAIGSDVQAFDADLSALAGLTSAADKGIQWTGSGAAATYDLTTAGKALLDDANAAAQLVTLGLSATAAELNIMDGVTSTAAELNVLDGITSTVAELNIMDGVTSTAAEINILDGVTSTAAELNILDGVTSTAAEINILDGVTSTAAELNIMDGGTAATGTTLVAADRVPVNDNGTMVQVAMSDFETFMESNLDTLNSVTSATSLAAVGTITTGVWSGTALVDAKVADALTISGGTVNASIIGGGTPAAGTFTTLTANDQLVVAAGATITADTTDEITLAVKGVGSQTANMITVEISDGTDKFVIAADGSVVISQDLTLASGATVTGILDEDAMGSNSATALATQQSIKAYVDSEVGSSALTIGADSGSDDTVTVGTDTLDISGGNMITTTVSDNDISIALDATITGNTAFTSGQVNADNITLDGNVISTTNTNGNLVLTPHGSGAVVVSGDLTVNGTTTTVNSTVVTLDDPIMQLGGDSAPGSDDNKDRGVAFRWHNGSAAKNGWFGYDDSISKFTFVPDATITSEVVAGSAGNVIFGNIEGTITTAAQNSITSATGLVSVGAIGTGSWAATDVAVAHGGTGSSTASGARTNLGVAIGSDVQAYDAELAAIAGLTSAANKGITFTGDGTAGVYDLSAAALTILDDANVAAMLVTLGLSATAAELNIMDGVTSTAAELNILDGVTSTAAELNILDGVTSTAAELNILDGVTATAAEISISDGGTAATSTTLADADRLIVNDNGTMVQVALSDFETYFEAGLDTLNAVTSASSLATVGTITSGAWTATDVAVLHGGTGSSTAAGALTNLGLTATAAEINALDGITSTVAELNILDGVTSTAAELNILDGVTATAAELNISDGGTSATSTTLADADRVVVNDGGTMVQVALSDFETYFEAGLDTLNAVTSASSLATVGTIGTGVWEATDVAVAHGGTGASSLTANSLLTGNGTAAIQAEANITYDGTTFGVNDAATFNEGGGDNDFRIESDNQANMFVVDASVDAIGIMTATPNAGTVLDMSGSTESLLLPSGTTAQRPGTGVAGMFRYNSTTSKFEYYNGSAWAGATTEFTIVRSETATGDGSTVAFTGLNAALTTAGCMVMINGVVQLPTTAYAISGTTITFTAAPANGDKIEIREFITTTSVNALEDADGDTKIQVEESSDEDIIRFDTGGTERFTVTAAGHVVPTLDATYDLGTSSLGWRNIYGVSSSAKYADLAERYTSDATYEAGTVVTFGGDAEVTMSTETMDSRIAGVVSTNPGYLMNADLEGTQVPVALTGRVPVKVTGTVRKGDMLVSAGEGYAKAEANPRMGSVIGKALEDFNGTNGIIEVVVGRL
jgi:hypothetical protein